MTSHEVTLPVGVNLPTYNQIQPGNAESLNEPIKSIVVAAPKVQLNRNQRAISRANMAMLLI